MPIYVKAIAANDIVIGGSFVSTGGVGASGVRQYDPGAPRSLHWASGDALTEFVSLNGRYLKGNHGPSGGWEH